MSSFSSPKKKSPYGINLKETVTNYWACTTITINISFVVVVVVYSYTMKKKRSIKK